MMTTMAALMGALPIALGFGADGASRRPLGLVVVGGLHRLAVHHAVYHAGDLPVLEEFQEKVLDRIPFFRSERKQPRHRVPIWFRRKVEIDHVLLSAA